MNRSRLLACVLFVGWGLGASVAAQAAIVYDCTLDTRLRRTGSTDVGGTAVIGAGEQGCSATVNESGKGRATATSSAAPGVLKVATTADTLNQAPSGPGEPWRAQSQVQTSFTDTIRIDAAGKTSSDWGWMTFNLQLSGFAQASYPDWDGVGVQPATRLRFFACATTPSFSNSGQTAIGCVGDLSGNIPRLNNPPQWTGESLVVSQAQTLRLPFDFAKNINISMLLGLVTWADAPDTSIVGAFDNSAYWGGIVSVTDRFNNPLVSGSATTAGQYRLTSSAGVDWHASFVPTPVPEPPAALLALAGLALLGWRKAQAARPQ